MKESGRFRGVRPQHPAAAAGTPDTNPGTVPPICCLSTRVRTCGSKCTPRCGVTPRNLPLSHIGVPAASLRKFTLAYWGCTPKPSKIPLKWISDFHSLVQPSLGDIGSIFTATIPSAVEEFRSISMRCWQTWHWKKATKGSLKPSNYGFDPIRPRNVMANCLTEFSRVWAYNPELV
jgi:hypothetical protein